MIDEKFTRVSKCIQKEKRVLEDSVHFERAIVSIVQRSTNATFRESVRAMLNVPNVDEIGSLVRQLYIKTLLGNGEDNEEDEDKDEENNDEQVDGKSERADPLTSTTATTTAAIAKKNNKKNKRNNENKENGNNKQRTQSKKAKTTVTNANIDSTTNSSTMSSSQQ
jgi:hypothetical protein